MNQISFVTLDPSHCYNHKNQLHIGWKTFFIFLLWSWLYAECQNPVVEESDDDMDEDIHAQGATNAAEEEEFDEIVESDIELEGEIVEADNDPPQKVT